jgi:molybdopterin synthase catalytic subunit/molybdopterin converting factor small subunit
MEVCIRLFASYRDQVGTNRLAFTLASGSNVSTLVTLLVERVESLPRDFRPYLIAVGEEFASMDYILHEGDEVAFYPPVSGGVDVRIVNTPIDPRELADSIRSPGNGAIVTMEGTTRNYTNGDAVLFLEYEADQRMAEKVMAHVLEEASNLFGVTALAARHRIGRLEIGDVSLVVAAASPHRREAFLATQYVVDRIKRIVPIWKKEAFANGSIWIGSACEPNHSLTTSGSHNNALPYEQGTANIRSDTRA